MTNDILGYNYDVIDHIVRFADTSDLAPVALLAMGLQESNLNPYAAGDLSIGGSYGVFQIYVKAHGHTPDYWQGIDGLDRSMAEMAARWRQAFGACGGWAAVTSDLVAFVQQWAPMAQGSIAWNEPMARERVSMAVALYTLYLRQQTAPAPVDDGKLRTAIDGLTINADRLDQLAGEVAAIAQGARDVVARVS